MNPAAGARRMRKRNDKGPSAGVRDNPLCADQLREGDIRQKSLYRESPHRNQNLWPHDLQLGFEPVCATRLFPAIGDAVAPPTRMRTGVTARDGGDVNNLTRLRFIETGAREPAKKRSSGSAREWNTSFCLHLSGSLPHQHRARIRGARHHRTNTGAEAAALASAERISVLKKSAGFRCSPHRQVANRITSQT